MVFQSAEYYRWYREKNSEKLKEYFREYNSERYKTHYEQERARRMRYQDKNPIHIRANQLVHNAIKSGRLLREPCMDCGAKAEAHHDYYGRPFDVLWLCSFHHSARHKYLKSINHNPEPTIAEIELLFTRLQLPKRAKQSSVAK